MKKLFISPEIREDIVTLMARKKKGRDPYAPYTSPTMLASEKNTIDHLDSKPTLYEETQFSGAHT